MCPAYDWTCPKCGTFEITKGMRDPDPLVGNLGHAILFYAALWQMFRLALPCLTFASLSSCAHRSCLGILVPWHT